MNKSTKQTLLSSWIRRGAAYGEDQVVSLVPAEKRKREEPEPEPEEKKRAASLSDKAADDAEDDGDGRRDVDRDGKNAPPPPASPSSSSEGEPDLDDDVANDDDDDDHENEHGVDEHGLTAYEREREALIARNRQALAALGVASAARALACRENADAAAAAAAAAQKRRRASSKKRRAGASTSSTAAFPEEIAARRSSLRPRRGGVAVAGGAGRTATATATTAEEGEAAAALGPPLRLQRTPTPEPETYDNRIVLSYIVDGSRRRGKAREEEEGARTSPPPRSSSSPAPPLPPSLRRLPLVLSGPVVRAYSVSASGCGSLLAAGGKDGWACIWGLRGLGDEQGEERGEEEKENNEEEEEEDEEEEQDQPERAPLLSARLHRSWIADVALVSSSSNNNNGNGGGAAAAPLLLTAANDGTLAVHDTGAAAELKKKNGGKKEQGADDDDADDAPAAAPAGAPRRLASATPHAGSGIFSMAVNEFSSSGESRFFFFDVATASKDGSLAVSRVENRGGEVKTLATIEDAHGGAVAKCVRWRDGVTLASCGNDGAARLWDVRCPSGGGGGGGGGGIGGGGGAAVEIAEATVGGVAANVLRWRPEESGNSAAPPNHLLVAGTNSEALMFDVRRPREPLFSLKPPPPPSGSAAGGGRSSSVIYQPCFVAHGRAVAVGLPRSRVVSLFDAADGTPLSRGDVGGHDASTLASFGAGEGGGGAGEEVVAAVGTRCLHLFSPRF